MLVQDIRKNTLKITDMPAKEGTCLNKNMIFKIKSH